MCRRHILIIEPHLSGHHGVWLKWMIEALVKRDYLVTIGTIHENLSSPLFQEIMNTGNHNVRVSALPWGQNRIRMPGHLQIVFNEFKYARLFRKLFKLVNSKSKLHGVLIPYLDYCSNAVALQKELFESVPWYCVAMRPSFHFNKMGLLDKKGKTEIVKRFLFARLLQKENLKACFTIDETLIEYINENLPSRSDRLVYLQDPVDMRTDMSRAEARRFLSIPKNIFIILVYGSLTRRKGIDSLMNVIAADKLPQDICLLLIGKQGEDVKKTILSYQKDENISARIRYLNQYVDSKIELAAFASADLVWMGYKGHPHMSGVLVQAGIMALPVIACNEGLIGYHTKKNQSGILVDVDDMNSVSGAIVHLYENPKLRKQYGANGYKCFRNYTIINAKNCLGDQIDEDQKCVAR